MKVGQRATIRLREIWDEHLALVSNTPLPRWHPSASYSHLPPPLQPRNNPATTAHHGSLLAATATELAAAAVMGSRALCPRACWYAFFVLIVTNNSIKLNSLFQTPPAITTPPTLPHRRPSPIAHQHQHPRRWRRRRRRWQ